MNDCWITGDKTPDKSGIYWCYFVFPAVYEEGHMIHPGQSLYGTISVVVDEGDNSIVSANGDYDECWDDVAYWRLFPLPIDAP